MSTELALGGVLVAALVLYILLGGADFGGGIWDFAAAGPRRDAQRALIERAIGPVWEANHVWLILFVVVLFSAFPRAFAVFSIACHVPLTLLLVGIVFRGSTFAFRTYDKDNPRRRAGWGLLFSVASLLAPLLLGVIVGATASGALAPFLEGDAGRSAPLVAYLAPFLTPFPLLVGALTLVICAHLAAVYLTVEAEGTPLEGDFRRRAVVSGIALLVVGAVTLVAARGAAPYLWGNLTEKPWSVPLLGGAAVVGAVDLGALVRGKPRLARLAAGALAALMIVGWAVGQAPYLIVPGLTLQAAAAGPRTQRLVLWILAAGTTVLVPSLYALFRVFKASQPGSGSPAKLR